MTNKPSIPSWQRASSDTPVSPSLSSPEPEEQQSPAVQAPTPTEVDIASDESDDGLPASSQLLEQAQRFLEDPAIRDAPREKKVAFLESKGVRAGDIKTLLGEKVDKAMQIEGSGFEEMEEVEVEEAGERAWATTPPKPADVPEIRTPPRDIPPIVTYPEFLANTEKPPPLITTKRLVATAYVTGGLMASIYGFSKYIIAPMTQTLAESRHDFASHTQEQLTRFNERLGKAVSIDPATKTKPITDTADDISEADSDPTELYHRDCGTQTTPSLSRRPSTSAPDPEPTVTAHENRLKIIKSHLQELESNRTSDSTSRDSLRTKMSDLSTYLSEMSYQNQYSGMSFYGSNYSLGGNNDGKNDQIEVLKSDIRAVKGVFLSARNFPAGGRGAPGMPATRVGV
ncbi:hypothetical protein EJ02DRAFT_512980 [Clathrospora elynae]|uniref:Peroxisomal membrane protein PEX14 n=1 Tax=Clathrospora elynae TaxID=706981 RepID=A0A6A5SJ47_9PLEO|nr:hypothetical protein EJ02DRAFT_512980 [Clathrospora elynae]